MSFLCSAKSLRKNDLILYDIYKDVQKYLIVKKEVKKIEHAGIEELLLFVNLIVTAIHENNTLTKMKHHTWMETMI